MLRMHTIAATTGFAITLSALVPTLQAQVFPGAGGGMAGPAPGMMGMGMGGGQTGPIMILLAPSVQKELKLTAEQKAKIYDFAKKAGQKNRDLMQNIAFNRGNANPQVMMEARKQLQQETDKGIAEILEPKQNERLDQIVLQNDGPLAVARPEIAAKLRLNESQREYVQGVMSQMGRELFMARRQGAATGQFNAAQMREMTAQLRKEAVKEISKVIDRKQQKTFNSMLGAPFDLTKLETETASSEAAAAGPADPSKPADATAAGTEPDKETAKESAPSTPTKGRSRSGSGSNP